ncbi:hypothetical protein BKA70DRAFT_1307854 [Coprinopsis sp. MPI-PUGE-AT-0042]|nr:hypothetical protein BKA70DRAFT_1307854 [Coprinopsis sp. MPI-PUGE-AT-0042]
MLAAREGHECIVELLLFPFGTLHASDHAVISAAADDLTHQNEMASGDCGLVILTQGNVTAITNTCDSTVNLLNNHGTAHLENTGWTVGVAPEDGTVNVSNDHGITNLVSIHGTANLVNNGGTVGVVHNNGTVNGSNDHGTTNLVNNHGTANLDNDGGTLGLVDNDGTVNVTNEHGTTNLVGNHGTVNLANNGGTVGLVHNYRTVNVVNTHGTVNLANNYGTVNLASSHGTVNVVNNHGIVNVENLHGTVGLVHNYRIVNLVNVHGTANVVDNQGTINLVNNDNSTALSLSAANGIKSVIELLCTSAQPLRRQQMARMLLDMLSIAATTRSSTDGHIGMTELGNEGVANISEISQPIPHDSSDEDGFDSDTSEAYHDAEEGSEEDG